MLNQLVGGHDWQQVYRTTNILAIGRPFALSPTLRRMIYDQVKIKSLRGVRKWSQMELARRAGLSQATISEVEAGEEHVKAHTLQAICHALGVPLKDVMRVKGTKQEEVQQTDEAISLCNSLDPRDRAAWIAAGKALLENSPKRRS